eukprot:TRINITY_DN167_c0_g2_i1.p5 TRINITY_DN167_c0_g2~~TRINITY_DN167_c0_g2_i1.p5  ORF type:complete len:101 (+),score=6.90 TRINITY_DN167_c0_g2_i1:438-740(+)
MSRMKHRFRFFSRTELLQLPIIGKTVFKYSNGMLAPTRTGSLRNIQALGGSGFGGGNNVPTFEEVSAKLCEESSSESSEKEESLSFLYDFAPGIDNKVRS